MKKIWSAAKLNRKRIYNILAVVVGGVAAYLFCRLLSILLISGYGSYFIYLIAALVVALITQRWIYGIATSVLSALVQYWLQPETFYIDEMMTEELVRDGTAFLLIAALECYLVQKFTKKFDLEFLSPKNMRRLKQENGALREENQVLRAERQEVESEAQQEKLRADLLRAVSHDLRTPLTSIAGDSSLLLEQGEELSTEEWQRLSENIHDEALWLNHMVENLLSVTRMHDGKAQLHKNMEVVEEVLQETLTKFRKRFPQQEIAAYVPQDEILMAPMDAMLIEQVLMNLLENAVRHSGVKDTITLSAERSGRNVLLSVRDYGYGIDEENLPGLFSGSFIKEDATRGMGIGLSVCYAIVTAHGGHIWAENKSDSGAEFQFTLPMEEERIPSQ